MQRSAFFIKKSALIAASFAAALTVSTAAQAACAVSLGSAIAGSQNRAIAFARQDAFAKVAQAAQGQPITNMDYSEPACMYLDDGSNKVKCDVQLSFCTQPTAMQPVNPQNPPIGKKHGRQNFGQCLTLSTSAQSRSLERAKAAVIKAMSRALLGRAGVTLNDPRVTGADPACFYLDDGTNAAVCKMTTKFCG